MIHGKSLLFIMNSSLEPKFIFRRFVAIIANLKLAIVLLLAIA